jgi:hypothetical protein
MEDSYRRSAGVQRTDFKIAMIKLSKNDKYFWTEHSKFKMRQYGLSPQRVARVIRNPERMEIGIVKNTIAVMQPTSIKYKNFKKIWSQEIWAMYQNSVIQNPQSENSKKFKKSMKLEVKKLKIISVWRYPGISPRNNPIPREIIREIENLA